MSSEEVITEEEVDALMDGVASGEVDAMAPVTAAPGEVIPYDISGQDRIERGRLPVLDVINERFAGYFREGLYTILQQVADVSVGGLKTVRFGDYVHALDVPVSLNLARIDPLPGTALFVFDNRLVYTIVDLFFGGYGEQDEASEGHELTTIENRVVLLVLEQVFSDMKRAWDSVLSLECTYLKSESNPQFASIASSKEPLVVSSFQVNLEKCSGELQICMPLSMIEPVRNQLNSGARMNQSGSDEERLQALQDRLQEAEVELHGTCAEAELTLRDVFNLKAGDVIPVEMPHMVVLQVESVPVCYGRFGIHKGRNAVKVVARVNNPDNPEHEA